MAREELDPETFMSIDFVYQVGLLTLGWSMVEYGLDAAIEEVIRHHDGAAAIQSDVPVSLKAKVAYLKKAMKLPSLADVRECGLAFIAECMELKDLRHDMVHGIVGGSEWPITYKFLRYEYRGSSLKPLAFTYTMKDLKAMTRLIGSLADRLSFFNDLIAGRDVEEAKRQIAVGKPAIAVPKKKLILQSGQSGDSTRIK